MFWKKFIIVEDDEIVAEDESCGVGSDSEYMRHHVLTQRPQATLQSDMTRYEDEKFSNFSKFVGFKL